MPEGKCPQCGASFTGWALIDSQYQTCPNCGIKLEIINNNRTTKKLTKTPIDEPVPDITSDDKLTL